MASVALVYRFWFAGGSGEPSTDLTTPALDGTPTTPVDATTPGDVSAAPDGATESGFVIDPAQSLARLEIDEELQGQPKHVVGTIDQGAGQFWVDLEDLGSARLSEMVVNACTLTTDSERRDRASQGPVILGSARDEFELITFASTSVEGLEGSAEPRTTLQFTITGDLTVNATTKSVSFDATVTWLDGSTLQGTATADVTRDIFGIGIPSVPGFANVTNEVLIGLDFFAVAG